VHITEANHDEESSDEISLAVLRAAPVYQSLPGLVEDPYIASANIANSLGSFEVKVEIDSGSFSTILPQKEVPAAMLKKLKPAPLTISGLYGRAQSPLGLLELKLKFGTEPELDAKVYILESCPCLLGRDVLRGRDVRAIELGRNCLRLIFDSRYKSCPPQKVPFVKNFHVGVARPEGDDENHQANGKNPILWVKQNLGIDLPQHAPLDHRRLIAGDIKEFKDAFSTGSAG
jgi:hypothetical protein